MSLIKCPECGHQVSEHASFCPSCGCNIQYIKDYYRKMEEDKAKIAAIKNRSAYIYETLNIEEKSFIDELKAELERRGVSFYYDSNREFVGFRPSKNEPLLIYLSRRTDGRLFIHLRDFRNGQNNSSVFEEDKIYEYLKYANTVLFKVEIKKEYQSIEKEPQATINAFVIRNNEANTYFQEYRKSKQYETAGYGPGDEHGSFKIINIPYFTLDINKAQHFFRKESAQDIIAKLKGIYDNLEVVEHPFIQY